MTLTVEQIAIALEKKAGNITHAANVLKVTRWALYKRINGEETLQQIVTDAREALVDIAESKLLQQVKKGNIAAIIFTLKTQGKARGYVERTEITGADGGPIEFYADERAQAQKELDVWREQQKKSTETLNG